MFRTCETRLGWVSSVPWGRRCSHDRSEVLGRCLPPHNGMAPATLVFLPAPESESEIFWGGRRLAPLSWDSVSTAGPAYRRLEEAEGQPATRHREHDVPGRALPPPICFALAARAEEVLRLDVTDLDRANRRARTIRKGGKEDELLYDVRTARMLGQLLGRRIGPVFLSTRRAPEDGTVLDKDIDPHSRRRRMTYRTADRHLGAATDGWDLHDLRHSRLTHAGEDGATEADLMNLSGHEDRRTLQRYLNSRELHQMSEKSLVAC